MAPFPRQNGSARVGGNLRPHRDPLPFAEQIGDERQAANVERIVAKIYSTIIEASQFVFQIPGS